MCIRDRHHHEQLVCVIQDGVSRQHLDDMVSGKEGDRELFQVGDKMCIRDRISVCPQEV